MGANADHRPVDGLMHIRERRAAFDDAHDKFVRQVRMRTAVAAALDEGQVLMFAGVIDSLGRESLDRLRQQTGVIGNFRFFDFSPPRCSTGSSPSTRCHSKEVFEPYTSKLSVYCRAASKR